MNFFRPDIDYPYGATFRERVGLVLWWGGLYYAGMSLLFGTAAALPMMIFEHPRLGFELFSKCVGMAVLWWIMGRVFLNLFNAR